MSSIRCSEAGTALLCLVVLVAAVGTASAFSVSASNVPAESQVGDRVTVTYTIEDPFTDVPNQWTLRGATELVNVSWTVTVERAGSVESQETYGSQSFEQALDVDDGGDKIVVDLAGTAPGVENFTYAPPQEYQIAGLDRVAGNNPVEVQNSTAHHYTAESREARQAIDAAGDAIEAAGGNGEAETQRQNAIDAYESEEFGLATRLAEDAESTAQGARQSQQLLSTVLIAVVVLLVLGAAGGGIYYWRSQQDEYSKL